MYTFIPDPSQISLSEYRHNKEKSQISPSEYSGNEKKRKKIASTHLLDVLKKIYQHTFCNEKKKKKCIHTPSGRVCCVQSYSPWLLPPFCAPFLPTVHAGEQLLSNYYWQSSKELYNFSLVYHERLYREICYSNITDNIDRNYRTLSMFSCPLECLP